MDYDPYVRVTSTLLERSLPTRLDVPTVRPAPTVAAQFFLDIRSASRHPVGRVELLDRFTAIRSDNTQLIAARRKRQDLGSGIFAAAFIPPEHEVVIGVIRDGQHCRVQKCAAFQFGPVHAFNTTAPHARPINAPPRTSLG